MNLISFINRNKVRFLYNLKVFYFVKLIVLFNFTYVIYAFVLIFTYNHDDYIIEDSSIETNNEVKEVIADSVSKVIEEKTLKDNIKIDSIGVLFTFPTYVNSIIDTYIV